MKFPLAFLITITLLHSTTITGSIYSYDSFEKVNGTILRFEGAGSQQIISEDGDYSIELENGAYNITALFLKNGTLKYYARERISVGLENQTFDIVLFDPSFFESEELPDLEIEIPQKAEDNAYLIIGVLLLAAVALFILRTKFLQFCPVCKFDGIYNTIKKYARLENFPGAKKQLGKEEMMVLRIIKENEGRIGQKTLRDILKFSESKMSLMLTELEVTGYIKRFKKGRENILKLKKGM